MFIILVLTYVKIDKCCWSQLNIRAATDDSSKIYKFSYISYLLLKLHLPLFAFALNFVKNETNKLEYIFVKNQTCFNLQESDMAAVICATIFGLIAAAETGYLVVVGIRARRAGRQPTPAVAPAAAAQGRQRTAVVGPFAVAMKSTAASAPDF